MMVASQLKQAGGIKMDLGVCGWLTKANDVTGRWFLREVVKEEAEYEELWLGREEWWRSLEGFFRES